MQKNILFKLTLGLYYLLLGVWLGSTIAIALTAPATFKTVRIYEAAPGIEPFNNTIFEGSWANIIAGAAVGQSIHNIAILHLMCVIGIVLCIFLLRILFAGRINKFAAFARLSLLMGAAALLGVHLYLTEPAMNQLRSTMYNTDINQTERNAANEQFQSIHKLSEQLTGFSALLLAGMFLTSPFIYRNSPISEDKNPWSSNTDV